MSVEEALTDLQLMGYVSKNYEGVKVRGVKNEEYLDAISKARLEAAKLESVIAELYPFVGNSCPDECKYRDECDALNCGECIAYTRYFEVLNGMGIEVDE